MPTFGERVPGQTYIIRPGAYAVIFNGHGLVALLQTKQGHFLPGGGAVPSETPAETLQREVREECGYTVDIHRQIGQAVDYIFARGEDTYFEIQSTFFEASLGKKLPGQTDEDHRLVWHELQEAIHLLIRPSQQWALQEAMASNGTHDRARDTGGRC